MPELPPKPEGVNVDCVTIKPAVPCAYCTRLATFALVKPLKKRVQGRLLKLFELFPICYLHLKLIKREQEVMERFKQIAQEEAQTEENEEHEQ